MLIPIESGLTMEQLNQRQMQILKSIITEYTLTGEPVGSEILDKKYNLGVSPATVRNEMTALAKKGYLRKEHFSSGRVPTVTAFRFYINNIMKQKELSTAEEVAYKNDIWDFKSEIHQLLQHVTQILARKTNLLAMATTNSGDVYYFGVNNLLTQKEFYNSEFSSFFFERLDEFSFWKNILRHFRQTEDDILFILGDEHEKGTMLEPSASVFGEFNGEKIQGALGVAGTKRMQYEMVVPSVKYCTHLIEQIIREQGL